MSDVQSLNHSRWECKYHMTWIPKYRRKSLYDGLRKYLGDVLRVLARQKECEILEGHLMENYVRIFVLVPPKYAVSQVIGYLKGKSVIHIARVYMGQKRNYKGQHFWVRGYHKKITLILFLAL